MELLLLFIGAVLGVIITRVYASRREVWGHIDVDPNTGLCRIQLANVQLGNRRIKHAVFIIHHVEVPIPEDEFSRDEPPL